MSLRRLRLLEFAVHNISEVVVPAVFPSFNHTTHQTQPTHSTNDNQKSFLTGPQAIPDDDDDDDDDDTDWELIIEEFLALIVIGIIAVLVFLAYMSYKTRYQQMIDEGIKIEGQNLNPNEASHLKQWVFNPEEWKVDEVNVRLDNTPEWRYIMLDFKQGKNVTKTISTNTPLQKYKDNCYFEIEVASTHPETDIVIGLCTKEAYDQDALPGAVYNSIGFHSDGYITINGVKRNDYSFKAGFGETIGFGYNFEGHGIFLFHNGKFLNEPPRSPSPSKNTPVSSPTKKPTTKVVESFPLYPPENIKQFQFNYDIKIQEAIYYPIIGSTGPCSIILNIGGAPFRAKHKAICKGLL